MCCSSKWPCAFLCKSSISADTGAAPRRGSPRTAAFTKPSAFAGKRAAWEARTAAVSYLPGLWKGKEKAQPPPLVRCISTGASKQRAFFFGGGQLFHLFFENKTFVLQAGTSGLFINCFLPQNNSHFLPTAFSEPFHSPPCEQPCCSHGKYQESFPHKLS